jgi:hypothetical protein
MAKLDEHTAAHMAALLNIQVTAEQAKRIAAQLAPAIETVAAQALPFDTEPSNLARNLTRGAK